MNITYDTHPEAYLLPETPVIRLSPLRNTRPKVRRNDRCQFCTSGVKFKFCHGRATVGSPTQAIFAGHMQEKPTAFTYTPAVALGPIPATRESL